MNLRELVEIGKKATPGPWKAYTLVNGDAIVWGPKSKPGTSNDFLCNIAHGVPPGDDDEKVWAAFDFREKANAELVAATPDLLATAEKLATMLRKSDLMCKNYRGQSTLGNPVDGRCGKCIPCLARQLLKDIGWEKTP